MDATQIKLMTIDELMALGSDARVEIIDGEIVEMSPNGLQHHFIGGDIFRIFDHHVYPKKLGHVFMDNLIYLLDTEGPGIKGAQVPDVSFIRRGRITKEFDLTRPFPGAPDFAVEVMSPDDKPDEVLKRVRKYLEHGTDEVWVVYPAQQEIHQYRRDTPDLVRVYRPGDTIDMSRLLPDLMVNVTDCFVIDLN